MIGLSCTTFDPAREKAYIDDLHLKCFELIKKKVKGEAWQSSRDDKEISQYVCGIIDFEDTIERAMKNEKLWQEVIASSICEWEKKDETIPR